MQAQVEPHFLFNTLASVQYLTETDPRQAGALLGHLIDYLRAALPQLRAHSTTLGREAELARAYLNILKMRIGARLTFAVDIPAELVSQPFPPNLLISLVENAIKHGIEPCPGGGAIEVVARLDATHGSPALVVSVADTGAGLGSHAPGQGIGLANIRERLMLLHGNRAALELEENTPRGFVARLVLPVTHAPANPSLQLARELP